MKLTEKELDEMAKDMILVLQRWGLWKDLSIFTNGNRYTDEKGFESVYQGIPHVRFEEGVDPEEYMKGPCGEPDEDGKLEWASLANPEHIFDMVFEGPLYELIRNHVYAPDIKGISEEGWNYLFEQGDDLEECLEEEFEVGSREELAEQVWSNIYDNPELSYWDPVEFDTWEEYMELHPEFSDDALNGMLAYMSFTTYEEYCYYREAGMETFIRDKADEIDGLWKDMVEKAKQELKQRKVVDFGEIRQHVMDEFNEVFDKRDLWYESCHGWSITSYGK